MAGETTLTKRIFAVLAMAARYRLFLRLFFLALLGLSIFLIVRTNFTNDFAEMLPDNSRSALAFQRIANSPMFNKVIVVLHLKQGVFSGSGLPQEIEKTAERLKDNPYITRADYRFFPESLSGELAGITAFLPQISAPPDSLFTSQNAQDTVRKISRRLYLPSAAGQTGFLRADPFGLNLPLYRKLDEFRSVSGASFLPNFPYLVSQDEKHAMMLLETTVPVSDAAGSRKLLDSLDKVLQKLPPEMEAEIISGHLHAVSNETILKKDIGTVGIMSVILFSLLFVLFYRCDFRSLAIPVLPVLASLIFLHRRYGWSRDQPRSGLRHPHLRRSQELPFPLPETGASRPCDLRRSRHLGAGIRSLSLFENQRLPPARFLCRDKSASQFFPDAVAASFASGKTQENPGDHETFPFSRPPSGNLYGRMDSCFHFFLFHSWKTGVSDGYPPV